MSVTNGYIARHCNTFMIDEHIHIVHRVTGVKERRSVEWLTTPSQSVAGSEGKYEFVAGQRQPLGGEFAVPKGREGEIHQRSSAPARELQTIRRARTAFASKVCLVCAACTGTSTKATKIQRKRTASKPAISSERDWYASNTCRRSGIVTTPSDVVSVTGQSSYLFMNVFGTRSQCEKRMSDGRRHTIVSATRSVWTAR